MKDIFSTKEDYLKFKQHWASYFNTEARHLDRNVYGNKKRKLTGSHFVLYALIRGKDWKLAIQGCSGDTFHSIERDLKSRWFYESQVFKDAFKLSDGQIEAIKIKAGAFPDCETSQESHSEDKATINQ